MLSSTALRTSLTLVLGVGFGLAAPPAAAHPVVPGVALHDTHAWYRWETTLTSTRCYANAYRDVVVAVTFTLQGGSQSFTGYGYWEGQQQAPL